ncbi:Response regulator protein VraR [Maioricimonas rarisocia]|uniref:Response regulator protein VraR n=1 Tax=Maioricimonas rarisocia TaxID=2528026 RepID=A0A517ZCM0_9PLAN|nr:response regulator transcription factor [Maioricimonas rarisocia]QDU40209.1 Response regulator protein VraR [Maioricimonas rarisocia]
MLVQDPLQTTPISLVLIDPNCLLVEALPKCLSDYANVSVVGRSLNVPDGLECLRRQKPDLCLVDSDLYTSGFRQFADELSVRLGETRLAIFVDELSDVQLETAISNQVRGFLSRRDSIREVGDSLTRLASGETVVSRNLAGRLERNPQTGEVRAIRRSQLERFSNRQLEVLMHLARGSRVREIAGLMHVSEKAVESHKFRIMKRLGIRDRVQLCRWAIREGLIEA